MGASPLEVWLREDLRADARAAPQAIRLKLDKLGRDPFAFFRGTLPDYVRRVQPELRGALAEPVGLITGDLHLENYGTYLDENGDIAFDLNDFDEVTRAPLVIDLRRLAASATLVTGSDAGAEAVVEGFLHGTDRSLETPLVPPPRVAALMAESEKIRRDAFVASATYNEGQRLRLKLGPTLHAPGAALEPALRLALRDLRARTPASRRRAARFYELLDAGRRLAGNGSLGRRRYLALVGGEAGAPVLLDLKEPRASPWGAVAQLLGARQRAFQVERAARLLRPASEQLLGVARLHGRLFQVREHSPHGLKLSVATLARPELLTYARYTGAHLARAWRRADQPAEALARSLQSGDAGRRLIAQARADAERTIADHARFLARREEIERGLELGREAA